MSIAEISLTADMSIWDGEVGLGMREGLVRLGVSLAGWFLGKGGGILSASGGCLKAFER